MMRKEQRDKPKVSRSEHHLILRIATTTLPCLYSQHCQKRLPNSLIIPHLIKHCSGSSRKCCRLDNADLQLPSLTGDLRYQSKLAERRTLTSFLPSNNTVHVSANCRTSAGHRWHYNNLRTTALIPLYVAFHH